MIGRKITVSPEAFRLHRESLFLDCHSHFLIHGTLLKRRFDRPQKPPLVYNPLVNLLTLPAAREGGLDAIGFTAYVPGRPWFKRTDRLLDRVLDRYEAICAECGPAMAHCTSPGQIRRAVEQRKLASFLTIEGGHVLEGRLETVEHFFRRGVRLMTITHFVSNGLADGTTSPYRLHQGLSPFGREVIQEMERLGMLVDLAHCTDKAFEDVMKVATKPMVFSHTGLRRYKNIERNIDDDQVKEIASRGGLVGVILFPSYLGNAGPGMRAAARTARTIADLSSPSVLCIGSDVDAGTFLPAGVSSVADFPQLTQALLDEGFSPDEVRGILGENFLRVWESVAA